LIFKVTDLDNLFFIALLKAEKEVVVRIIKNIKNKYERNQKGYLNVFLDRTYVF